MTEASRTMSHHGDDAAADKRFHSVTSLPSHTPMTLSRCPRRRCFMLSARRHAICSGAHLSMISRDAKHRQCPRRHDATAPQSVNARAKAASRPASPSTRNYEKCRPTKRETRKERRRLRLGEIRKEPCQCRPFQSTIRRRYKASQPTWTIRRARKIR